jgi:hypothetical protein
MSSDFAEDGPAQVQQTAEPSMLEFLEEGAARDEQMAKPRIPDSSENRSAEDKDATDKNHRISRDVRAPNLEGINNADSKESSQRRSKGSRLCKARRERLEEVVTRLIERCESGHLCLEEAVALEVPRSFKKNEFFMKKIRSAMKSRLGSHSNQQLCGLRTQNHQSMHSYPCVMGKNYNVRSCASSVSSEGPCLSDLPAVRELRERLQDECSQATTSELQNVDVKISDSSQDHNFFLSVVNADPFSPFPENGAIHAKDGPPKANKKRLVNKNVKAKAPGVAAVYHDVLALLEALANNPHAMESASEEACCHQHVAMSHMS